MESVILRYRFGESIDPLSHDESELSIHFAIEHKDQIMVKNVDLHDEYMDTLYVIIKDDVSRETLQRETKKTVADKLGVSITDVTVRNEISRP